MSLYGAFMTWLIVNELIVLCWLPETMSLAPDHHAEQQILDEANRR